MTEFDIERQNRAINTIDSRDNAWEFSQRLKLSAEWEVYVDMKVGWLENRRDWHQHGVGEVLLS